MVDDTPLDRAREQLEDEDLTSDPEENEEVPLPHKKPGRRVNSDFLVPALGELAHPFEDWILDKDAMYVYMLDYAKQEGFAVNPCKSGDMSSDGVVVMAENTETHTIYLRKLRRRTSVKN
jgi:hypothetical protein